MDLRLKGRTALVTGASAGLGAGAALITFPVFEQAAYITGASMPVDGGFVKSLT